MNIELVYEALEKVGNPNTLINLVSQRVRQLNAGAHAGGRPMIADTAKMGSADIAMREIVEGKIEFLPYVPEVSLEG